MGQCGPPRPITGASPWPWVAHSVSGLLRATNRPLQTCFRCGTVSETLHLNATRSNSPVHSSIGTPSGMTHAYARLLCPLTANQRTVSGSISLPARGFFSPFPHGTIRYRSLWLFSLGTWSSRLPTGFPVPGGTYAAVPESTLFRLRGSHPLWRPIPGSFD